MSYRQATPQDIGKVCRYRLSLDKAWQHGKITLVRDGRPVVEPKHYGSARLPSWENVEVPK